jgi:hypothetical protein
MTRHEGRALGRRDAIARQVAHAVDHVHRQRAAECEPEEGRFGGEAERASGRSREGRSSEAEPGAAPKARV